MLNFVLSSKHAFSGQVRSLTYILASERIIQNINHQLNIINTRYSSDAKKYGPIRGARDFYPEDLEFRSKLFDHWRELSIKHGFQEIETPIVENEEIYVRKGGEEITNQLYSFSDKSGRKLALRPEMTPSLSRMVQQKGISTPFPIKWFSISQCWRYERSTRGRRREHFQWNVDVIDDCLKDQDEDQESQKTGGNIKRRVGEGEVVSLLLDSLNQLFPPSSNDDSLARIQIQVFKRNKIEKMKNHSFCSFSMSFLCENRLILGSLLMRL